MIPVSRAINIIKRETGSLGVERIDLADSIGRVLAEDIIADTDLPPFDRSQMDGYAVKANDTANELRIVGESAAGRGWHRELKKGEVVRIMTGAPVPKGADAVQKMELATEADGFVTLNERTEKGRFIVKKGQEIKKGDIVIRKGETVTERIISVPAAFGYAKIKVSKRPRVSILSTGSEIVDIGKKPKRDQIRNSNSALLKMLCEQNGAEAKTFPIIGDSISDLKSQISKAARNADILVTTGGVSVGKYDLTKAALVELGAQVFFERVRLRPGKPTVFAKLNNTLVFGLPGNPVSAAVTYYLFVRTSILQMQKASHVELPRGFAVLTSTAKAAKERDTYLPATLVTDKKGTLKATPLRWHGSSDFVGFAQADCLVFVARGKSLSDGEVARIVYL